jgi:hypothetical protein
VRQALLRNKSYFRKEAPHVRGMSGWGTWIRTKIHSSKGWCAAIALCPSVRAGKFYHNPTGVILTSVNKNDSFFLEESLKNLINC